ncbi:MAG: hypothetical protein PHY09_11955 [Desulfuromonadaceae bacterium]|nr:hypothetical protein [Desulfuromonadaceae bacterium]MDD5106912.1 hypothetical protein [Desulfuromonadaceae bacterium]
MTELFIAEEHSQLYELWLERGYRGLAVCHIDFHCDMRGLLIDRRLGKACFVDQHIPYVHLLDSGSYLSHAIMNGTVTSLRWVHDEFGGRKHDYRHCVKFETDFSALPYRLFGNNKCVPVNFTEQSFDDWGGPQPGEFLDIDWDGIAFAGYDEQHIRRLMAEVLARDFAPSCIFLARSPDYCHHDRQLYEEFIGGLEAKFNIRATRLPSVETIAPVRSTFWKLYGIVDQFVLKRLHRLNLF